MDQQLRFLALLFMFIFTGIMADYVVPVLGKREGNGGMSRVND